MEDIKVILDLGNGYIKGAVLAQDEGKNVLLAKDMVKTKGMRKGKILDVDDFIYSVKVILESFEKKIGGGYIEDVYLGISHPDMIIRRVVEQKRVLSNDISAEDVDHLSNVIYDTSWETNYEIVKIIPVQWIIDEQLKLKDPVGMEGKKLDLVADVFMLPKRFYNNLIEVFEKLEIGIIDIVPNILGSAESVLDFDAKDLGTMLIDIGTNQTSFVVYEEGFPVLYDIIPIGGEDVTKDISIGLQLEIKDSENIKREKGVIIMSDDDEYPQDDEIDMKFLSDIIAARYEEIFDRINSKLRDIGMEGKLPGGVLLIGGASNIRNLDKLAKHMFRLATFYGYDKAINIGELSNNLQFINILGNYVWINKYSNENKKGGLGLDFSLFKKVGKFFKDLF